MGSSSSLPRKEPYAELVTVEEASAIQLLGSLLPTVAGGFAVFVFFLYLRSRWLEVYDPKQADGMYDYGLVVTKWCNVSEQRILSLFLKWNIHFSQ